MFFGSADKIGFVGRGVSVEVLWVVLDFDLGVKGILEGDKRSLAGVVCGIC
jgi:hypothetical protein